MKTMEVEQACQKEQPLDSSSNNANFVFRHLHEAHYPAHF